MKTIWKYSLPFRTPNYVHTQPLPKGARILHIGSQLNDLLFWAEIDTDNLLEERKFEICWTGREAGDGIYLGTAEVRLGSYADTLVCHVYEIIKS